MEAGIVNEPRSSFRAPRARAAAAPRPAPAAAEPREAAAAPAPVILSFDVEEHHRIEAAAGLAIDPALKAHYGERMEVATRGLLDTLARRGLRATFFVVGEIARLRPGLVRDIHR